VDKVKEAARLLASAISIERANPLLAALGFEGPSLALSSAAQYDLDLHPSISAASVARGGGALRGLVIHACGTVTTRELIQHTARALSNRVPHLLWLIVVIDDRRQEVAIACWSPGRRSPRVVALIATTDRVLDSDAETLCALCAAESTSDVLTHVRWVELLGREAITRRFFRSLKDVVEKLSGALPGSTATAQRRELAILTVSRLLFLSFLETKGWLAGDFDFLSNQFARCMMAGGGYHRRVLHPLFFGTLNTRVSERAERARAFGRIPFLNGGLFARSYLEKNCGHFVFPDDALGEVFSALLTSFRFSAREDSENWSETAVDPEILGKAFEALMASSERKTTGAFYTPQRLVEHVTESALVAALSPIVDHGILRRLLADGELPPPEARLVLLQRIESLKLLDPACGSGAFLVHALEKLSELRIRLGETDNVSSIRRKVLAASIFGVDINPMAVWLCQLRLWLAIVIDSSDPDPMHVLALPNLDRQIRIGDSLAGGSFSTPCSASRGKRLSALRSRYMRATGPRKKSLARELDREERREAISYIRASRERIRYRRKDIALSARSPDLFGSRPPTTQALDSLRALRKKERAESARERRLMNGGALPFSFDAHFADIGARGGFDVIVGNPPWVRIHNIGATARDELNREFVSFNRGAWREGAERAGSGNAFANQIDLSALFLERSISLLREDAALSLLVPAKLWRSLSGGGIRDLVSHTVTLTALEDMTESRSAFDAAVYPSLIVARKPAATDRVVFAAASHRRGSVIQWEMDSTALPLNHSAGSPWLLVPGEVRRSFDKVQAAGITLADSHIGRPVLGVKTGFNSAFIVTDEEAADIRTYVRPVARGETMSAWVLPPNRERIIWTHCGNGAPMTKLPPELLRRLQPSRRTLERRTDAKSASRWWSVFRTEGASSTCWRVVWCDFGKSPRAVVLPLGSDVVPLNTCYVARCAERKDALALTALLNGPLVAAWLGAIAEPARGGYHRYLGWTVSLLPIPRDWNRAVDVLAPLTERAIDGVIPDQQTLLAASLDAYRLRRCDVESLISWTHR